MRSWTVALVVVHGLDGPQDQDAGRVKMIAETEAMPDDQDVIHSDPEILGGTPVFVGTRVPVQTLLDYLEGGHPLAEFLDDFPTVTRAQAVAVLDEAKRLLVSRARAA